jgi:hypothetical protein
MKDLGAGILEVVVSEFGPQEALGRLSDPVWFQALGCVLGFDWHSSGLTTTVCAALKEALKSREKDLGLFVAGGKGPTSLKTPEEIANYAERYAIQKGKQLIYASRMAAKVDNSAVQDGYQIYHHTFFFTHDGQWAVVQQGMNVQTGWARRYHWLGRESLSFVCEPHTGICGPPSPAVLNMVAAESEPCRKTTALLARERPEAVLAEYRLIAHTRTLRLGRSHALPNEDYLERVLRQTFETQPEDFEKLLGMPGVGPATVRALALVAEVAFGAAPSFRDPARYAFAHGGKDGHPFPVNRKLYDQTIEFLQDALRKSKIDRSEKLAALRRLSSLKSPERKEWLGHDQH